MSKHLTTYVRRKAPHHVVLAFRRAKWARMPVKPIPITFQVWPQHRWNNVRRKALKVASRIGLSRRVWDRCRAESGSRRHADLHMLYGREAPKPGEFDRLMELAARWKQDGCPREWYPPRPSPPPRRIHRRASATAEAAR